MDGNRRWARERGLSIYKGHQAGYDKINQFVSWAKELGTSNFVFYGFSTENWSRPKKEVDYLMSLLGHGLKERLGSIQEDNMKIRILGQVERLSPDLRQLVHKIEKASASCTGGTIGLAISYGGRAEIVEVVNHLLKQGAQHIDEQQFSNELLTKGIPDPDIIIRTSGVRRLSNFLPWQSVYSELFFVESHWPDFSKEELISILNEYASRERRMGQ